MSYRMKLFQDELARCIQRLHNEGWLPNENMGEASVRDTETGNVTISIKPGTIGVTDPAAYFGSDMPVVDADGIHFIPCVKMEHVEDPTAAGDSFVGAFCTASTIGLPMGEVLAFANHTAALTVCRMGAQPSLPTISEVIDLMNERGKDSSAFEVLRG